jgi:opacity protein-like surface antigen
MNTKIITILALAAGVLTLRPAPARADTFVTPFLGVTFGGQAVVHKSTYGASIAVLGNSFGFELEYARTPNFFGDAPAGNSLTTIMGRYMVGGNPKFHRGLRPFAAVGAGVVRANVDASSLLPTGSTNRFGLDLGAGLIGFISPGLGIRADVRYVREVEKNPNGGILPVGNDFTFWRAGVGLTVRF